MKIFGSFFRKIGILFERKDSKILGIMNKIIVFIFVLLVGVSCQNISDKHLENEIQTEIQETKSINFSKYTDFQWDSVILLPPYTSIENLERTQNLDLSPLNTNIETLDSFYLLVFLKNKKAVKSVEIDKNLGEFDVKYTRLIPKNEKMIWKILS